LNSNENILSQINTIPKFTTAHSLLEDKFSIEISKNNKNKIELLLGDKVCFVKPHTNLVCETIVRGILPKRHNGLESPTVYVLVTDNKFDFYNITEIANKYQILDRVLENTIVRRFFTIYQLADFLIKDLQKDIKKFKSKLVIITGDFYLSDIQIPNEDKEDYLYPQMIKAVKKVTNSIIVMFSPIALPNLVNYDYKPKS
jgi:Rad51